MPPEFVEQLRGIAEAKEREEADYRRDSRRRLETLAAERTRAYRRYNLLKDMAAAADRPDGVEAQLSVALTETGWAAATAGYDELRDRLRPVAEMIHARLHPEPEASEVPGAPADIAAAFSAFEAWYHERFGQDFLDLLGREPPSFQPVVDF